MKPHDDNPDGACGPSIDEIERVVKRALRRYGLEAGNPQKDPSPETSFKVTDTADFITSSFRRCGLLPDPAPAGEPHALAPAGLKLRDLRRRSGWTTEEIADRTGFSADLVAAFEAGDSAAAGEMTCFDLEQLAEACCGTLADLLGQGHPWVKAALRREARRLEGRRSIDPHG